MSRAAAKGTLPPSLRRPRIAALRPITDATERSISPEMMTNVIITTTMAFSIDSWNRFTRLWTPR